MSVPCPLPRRGNTLETSGKESDIPSLNSSGDSDSTVGGEMMNVSEATRTGDSPVPRDIARGRRDHRWPLESDVVQAVPWQAALSPCQLILIPGPLMGW